MSTSTHYLQLPSSPTRRSSDLVIGDPGRETLAERTFVAIGPEIVFQGLRLEAAFPGRVLDGYAAEVRLTRAGADGREFGGCQGHGPHVRGGKRFGLESLTGFCRARRPGGRSRARQPGRLR